MRRLAALSLAIILLLSSAASVSADEPTPSIVDPVVCGLFIGGSMTVEPGTDILVQSGWFAATRGQIVSFMRDAVWTLSIDGTSVDVTPYLVGPTKLDRRFWLVSWDYPLPPLALGETVHVRMNLELRHPVFDGFSVYRAGEVFGGPLDCDVTGAPNPEEEEE